MKYLLTVLCLFAMPALADVYRSVNEAGETVYSDVQVKGSVRVDLPPLSTVKPPATLRQSAPATARHKAASGQAYRDFQVAAPGQESTIWNNEGNIQMSVVLDPPLHADQGDRIQYYLDGKPYGTPEQSLVCNLTGVDRGTHTLGASVVDSNGSSVISTGQVTVHLHKASTLNPNNPLYNGANGNGASK